MTTECNQFAFGFHPLKRLEIRAQFDGGAISSDGGGLLLREVEKRIGILHQFASCFTDYRNPDLIEHSVEELVAQRVYGLALGYEDLNDHEELRNDPLLAVLVEKANPSSQVLAGKSTLNRLELTKETARCLNLNNIVQSKVSINFGLGLCIQPCASAWKALESGYNPQTWINGNGGAVSPVIKSSWYGQPFLFQNARSTRFNQIGRAHV